MIELGYSTNGYPINLPFALEHIAQVGYTHVEILCDDPHWYALDVTEDDMVRIKATLEETELRVSNVNAFTAEGFWQRDGITPENIPPNQEFGPYFASSKKDFSPFGIDPHEWRIEYTKKCIDIAAFLGAPGISINTGKLSQGLTKEDAWSAIVSSFREIVVYSEKRNVRIFLEFEPGFECLWDSRDVMRLFNAIPSPHLMVNYDIGHGYVALGSGKAVARDMEMLGKKIGHFHIEDIARKEVGKSSHTHLMFGDGDIDFTPILKAIEKIGGGVVTCELYTYKDRWGWAARTAYKRLQKLIEQAAT